MQDRRERKSAPTSGDPSSDSVDVYVVLKTELGTIVVSLNQKAPLSSAAFLRLVEGGHYDGGMFFRTVRPDNDFGAAPITVVQAMTRQASDHRELTPHETTAATGLVHDDGALSLARSDARGGSASFFFVSIGRQPALDYGGARNPDGQGFAVFGKVISGMDVVRAIHGAETREASSDEPMSAQMIRRPVRILTARSIQRVYT